MAAGVKIGEERRGEGEELEGRGREGGLLDWQLGYLCCRSC